MPILKKSNDFFLYKKGDNAPTASNGYLTDDYISITGNHIAYDLNLVGNGKGNTKQTKYVKSIVPMALSGKICFMEPTTINDDLPQLELFEAAGFVQEKVADTSITLYPTLTAQNGTAIWYKGGVMKYILSNIVGRFDFVADASNTKFSANFELTGINDPSTIANETGVTPTFTENSYFKMTKDSYVTVGGVQKCPFGEISLTLNSETDEGEGTVICRKAEIEDFAPMLSFSEVLDTTGDSNLTPITNWLNDSDVAISFPLFSENFKMEIKINKGIEKPTEDNESGLKYLQKRNIRLLNDSNDRAFEIVITPL